MADRVGQQLGHYRLVRLLGQGGFAEVYLGEHIHLDASGHQGAAHPTDIRQHRAVSPGSQTYRPPGTLLYRACAGFGVEGTTPFLVMGYDPGGTLRQRHRAGRQAFPFKATPWAEKQLYGQADVFLFLFCFSVLKDVRVSDKETSGSVHAVLPKTRTEEITR